MQTNNIIICCLKNTYPYFEEYLNSLRRYIKMNLMLTDNYEKITYDTKTNYVFCQKLPEKLLNDSQYHNNITLINTEQVTRENIYNYCNNVLNNNINVVDYGIENIIYMGNKKNNLLVPYQYNDLEINKLKTFVTDIPKTYDVAFIGCKSTKRLNIINGLIKKGIKVLILDGLWRDDRDKKIASCKLLLNIHYHNSYNIYESLRCDRWLFSEMMVVSEDSNMNSSLDINKLIIFEKYDNLIDKVVNVIENYDKYYTQFKEEYNNSINGIKQKRLNKLMQIFN